MTAEIAVIRDSLEQLMDVRRTFLIRPLRNVNDFTRRTSCLLNPEESFGQVNVRSDSTPMQLVQRSEKAYRPTKGV